MHLISKTLLLLVALILTPAACAQTQQGHFTEASSSKVESNGKRIYLTGISASGSPIGSRGNSMGMGMGMHGSSCASCHGSDREGRRLWPRFWVKAPALTVHALFGDKDHGDESSAHGDHDLYDEKTLRLAITEGLDPAGNPLSTNMPRWTISDADLADLVTYLLQDAEH